jgi:hypothetical protein
MHTLTVYIADDCWSCAETRRILDDILPQFPDLLLNLVNTQLEPLPDHVFAVPTYLLNGEIVSLGNPTREALQKRLTTIFGK